MEIKYFPEKIEQFLFSGSKKIFSDEIIFLFSHISPFLILSKPAIALKIVVLPTPDGPRIEIMSP